MFSNKRYKPNSVYDAEQNPLPQYLRHSLALLSSQFFNSRMRNIELMDTSEHRLWALVTHYDGTNFCWLQPTRVKTLEPTSEYANYMRMVLAKTKTDRLKPLPEINIGTFCLARYEIDRRWYRAIVVDEPLDDAWLVLFIDFGNMQRTTSGYLAEPIQEAGNNFFDAPLQAVCCRIYNIVPRLPSLRDNIDRALEKSFMENPNQFYEVLVRNIRTDYVVEIDLFRHNPNLTGPNRLFRCHVGQELVDDSLAYFANPKAAYVCKLVKKDQDENKAHHH